MGMTENQTVGNCPEDVKKEFDDYDKVKSIIDDVQRSDIIIWDLHILYADKRVDESGKKYKCVELNSMEDLYDTEGENYKELKDKKEFKLLEIVFKLFKMKQIKEQKLKLENMMMKYNCESVLFLASKLYN